MKRNLLTLFLVIILAINVHSQVKIHKDYYAIFLKDKANNQCSVDNPDEFLSKKSIDRKKRFNIAINEQDLPVSYAYMRAINDLGFRITKTSKWLNCVVVEVSDTTELEKLKTLEFIVKKPASQAKNYKYKPYKQNKIKFDSVKSEISYGMASTQNKMIEIDKLHQLGFEGQDVLIAVLDAGFIRVDSLQSFKELWENNQIKYWYNFVNMNKDVFNRGSHGMQVLSTMACQTEDMRGTAPKANYVLFATEDGRSEYPIEEYNYVIALEHADSLGCDLIHASLGYNSFDDSLLNYTQAMMDGNTAISTIGADIASSKGILITVSAGNSGDDEWQHLTPPADADSCLTIGAVNFKRSPAGFSSLGPSADNRIKPEVCAQGVLTTVASQYGGFKKSSGTSFSSPIIAGATACLIGAFPEKTNMEIIEAVIKSADNLKKPNEKLGYGIPNYLKAYYFLKN